MRARLLAFTLAAFAALTMFGSTGASAQGGAVSLFANLNGNNECNPTGTCRTGDLDNNAFGTATVILLPGTTSRVCWAIVVTGINNPTLAHIHAGHAGIVGPISVTLVPPSSGNPGTSSGCTTTSAAVLNQIRKDPSNFYVNVHNNQFPVGAVRGQLF